MTRGPSAAGERVVVMTRNLYLGASLDPLLGSPPPGEIPFRVEEVWRAVVATDFPSRAEALAAEIAAAAPHLVAVQEAALWRVGGRGPGGPGYDFLALLVAALAARAARYHVAAQQTNFGGALPMPGGEVVHLEDRCAVLARSGVEVLESSAGGYQAAAKVALGGIELPVPRGWASVAARVNGRALRFTSTHIELPIPPDAAAHLAQARELAARAAGDPLPAVVAGDLNASPGAGAHAVLCAAGLQDGWEAAREGEQGFTCCHPGDLLAPEPRLSQRIDHVLHSRHFEAVAAEVVGARAEERTAAGLWPSDHAGVVVALRARDGGP